MLLLTMPAIIGWSLAFGSCHHQDLPAPALLAAAELEPDAFVWLGDNFYNDLFASGTPCNPAHCDKAGVLEALKGKALLTVFKLLTRLRPAFASRLAKEVVEKHNAAFNETADGDSLARRYRQLGSKPEFLALQRSAKATLATWDDHDYCRNNAGLDCPAAQRSRELFLRFWRGADALAQRGKRPGIYDAHSFDVPGSSRRVQVLLLDTRTFRGNLRLAPRNVSEAYSVQDASVQLLGDGQWAWLAEQLRQPASVRVICSSIAFAASYNGEVRAEPGDGIQTAVRWSARDVSQTPSDASNAPRALCPHTCYLYPILASLASLAITGLPSQEAWSLYPHEIRRMIGAWRSFISNASSQTSPSPALFLSSSLSLPRLFCNALHLSMSYRVCVCTSLTINPPDLVGFRPVPRSAHTQHRSFGRRLHLWRCALRGDERLRARGER
jgi:hypothetical protein